MGMILSPSQQTQPGFWSLWKTATFQPSNHHHIFHRFETCTCSWTKSSQQQWRTPRRPYWVINYHDPLRRPYFLLAGGIGPVDPLNSPWPFARKNPVGPGPAFCPKPAAMLTSQAYPTQLPLSCTDSLVQSQGINYETKHVSGWFGSRPHMHVFLHVVP